jgi:hypothetical protein
MPLLLLVLGAEPFLLRSIASLFKRLPDRGRVARSRIGYQIEFHLCQMVV